MTMSASEKPGPFELWQQAGGDGARYRDLMREHGHLLSPGDEGYEDAPRNLPCGWPGKRAGAGLLEHLDEFCLHCLAGDCGSCEGGLCRCDHDGRPTT